ncbi:glycosyltransferase 87 family protein [Kocuria rosea]|uniref:glycosyltransferase 87 family protein n=1 Tax=Kocuria rosea TaxID=1275 RepID=UPI0009E9A764|nr:glycosyltransferase 87 family protein [Kocuria polaris]
MSSDTTSSLRTRFRDRPSSGRRRAWWRSPRGLLTVFVGVHLVFLVFALQLSLSGAAFSDTYIYRAWAEAGFEDQNLNGEPTPWVYPVLALVPIALAGAAGPGPFFVLWVLMITVLNGWAVGKLTDWGRDRSAHPAAWWWLGFVFLMGWLGFARVDGLTAPLVLVALVYGAAHPVAASALLSVATWMKVWPAAVVLALVTVARRRVAVVVTGMLVSAAAAGVATAMGALPRLFDFLTQQGDRGMQLEATFTTPWLWSSVLGLGGSRMYMNTEINSMQVDGPGAATMAVLMQPLLLLAAAGVTVLIVRGLRTGERAGGTDRTELLLAGSLTMITVFVVFNKVGSPQFMVWLAPAVAVGLTHHWQAWRVPAAMLIAVAAATFFVYPLFYYELSHNSPVMALVLTLRNALLVVLLWWSARRLYQLGTPQPAPVLAAKES